MNKLQLLTVLLLIILIGAFSNWLLTSLDTEPLGIPKQIRHDPDYFLEDFTANVMTASGLPRYRLQGVRLEHFPDDDSILIQKLILQLFRNTLPEWTATAERGYIYDKGQRIELKGTVHLQRPAIASNHALELTTRDLVIYPEKEYAETEAAVNIISGKNTISAVGMRLDLSNGRLELLAKTQGNYVITPR